MEEARDAHGMWTAAGSADIINADTYSRAAQYKSSIYTSWNDYFKAVITHLAATDNEVEARKAGNEAEETATKKEQE